MDDTELLRKVRELRSRGLSPKEIARALGVRPAMVAPLVRVVAREAADTGPDPAVRCWVSPGWSAGLAVPAEHDWPDRPTPGADTGGLVGVLVARERGRVEGSVAVCGYLVDAFCLGVKDALGPRTMGQAGRRRFVDDFFGAFRGPPVEAPVDLARELVWGAVAYARDLGFRPHPDFARAAGHLEALDGPSVIGFGRYGKPSYMQGPYDDAGRILRTLRSHVGDDFHFTVAVDAATFAPA